jgi:hypothetical protein
MGELYERGDDVVRVPRLKSLCNADVMSSPQIDVDDVALVAHTEARLGETNPEVPSDLLHTLVGQAYARLTPAKVHTYLPVLITRELQENLRGHKTGRTDVLSLPR